MPRSKAGATVRLLSLDALDSLDEIRAICLPLLIAAEPPDFYTPDGLDDLNEAVMTGLSSLLTVLADDPDQTGTALDQAQLIGQRQVQQDLPLEGVLRSYRIVGQCLWEHFVATARATGAPVGDALLDGATDMWRVVDLLSSAASRGYRDEALRLRTREDRVQAALLGALLDGQGTDPRFARDAAVALGLGAREGLICVVGLPEAPGRLTFDNAQERLHIADVVSVWATHAGTEVGLVLSGRTGHSRIRELLTPAVRTRAGMSPTFHALADLPASRRFADLAARCSPESGGIGMLDDDLVAGLVVDSPLVAGRVFDRTISRLLAADPDEGQTLLKTVRAFLDAGCSINEAARSIYVHRNTLQQRLTRVDKLTGTDIRTFPDQVMWLLAIKQQDSRRLPPTESCER